MTVGKNSRASLPATPTTSCVCPVNPNSTMEETKPALAQVDKKPCYGSATIPDQVYLIAQPADSPYKLAFQLNQLANAKSWFLHPLNVTVVSEPAFEWVEEMKEERNDHDLGCGLVGCRAPLFRKFEFVAQQIVDRNLPGAFFMEDDVVFHTNIKELFPIYWHQVPNDYEFVYIGQLTRMWPDVVSRTIIRDMPSLPFAPHFAAISNLGARRILWWCRWQHWKVAHGDKIWPADVIPDIMLIQLFDTWLTAEQKSKWLTFESTVGIPAEYSGLSWTEMHTWKPNCTCDNFRSERCRPWLPLRGTGLAYQAACTDLFFADKTRITTGLFDVVENATNPTRI